MLLAGYPLLASIAGLVLFVPMTTNSCHHSTYQPFRAGPREALVNPGSLCWVALQVLAS